MTATGQDLTAADNSAPAAAGCGPPARLETAQRAFFDRSNSTRKGISRRVRPASAESPEKAQNRFSRRSEAGLQRWAAEAPKFDFRVESWGPNPTFRPFQTSKSGFSRQVSGSPDFSVEAFDAKIRHRWEQARERSKNHFRVDSRPRPASTSIISPEAHATRLWQRHRARHRTVQRTRAPPTHESSPEGARRLRRPQLPPPRPARATPPERRRRPDRRGCLSRVSGPARTFTASRRARRGAPRPRPGHGRARLDGPARRGPKATADNPASRRPTAKAARPRRATSLRRGPACRVEPRPSAASCTRPWPSPGSPARRVEPRAVPGARIAPRRPPTTPSSPRRLPPSAEREPATAIRASWRLSRRCSVAQGLRPVRADPHGRANSAGRRRSQQPRPGEGPPRRRDTPRSTPGREVALRGPAPRRQRPQ